MSEERRKLTQKEAADLMRLRLGDMYKLDPVVNITLGGEEYKLDFTLRSAEGILLETGFNLLSENYAEKLSDPTFLGSALYWGLVKHQPGVTPESAREMFSLRLRMYIQDRLIQALNLFLPDTSDIEVIPEKGGGPELVKADPLAKAASSGSDSTELPEDAEYLMGSSGAAATPK